MTCTDIKDTTSWGENKPQNVKNWRMPATNIVLALVGLTVVNLTFVILLGICASVELTFFKYPTIADT